MDADDYINFDCDDRESEPWQYDTRFQNKPRFFRQRADIKPITWTTGDGAVLELHEMEDKHLQNTLSYITRRAQEWEQVKKLALERTGVDAGEYIINGRYGHVWFDLFVKEVKRRQQS